MREVKAIIRSFMLEKVLHALGEIGELPGLTVSQVIGWGASKAADSDQIVHEAGHAFARMTKIEIVVPATLAPRVVEGIIKAARTGRPGDGKVFESEVARVVSIRTGSEGSAAP